MPVKMLDIHDTDSRQIKFGVEIRDPSVKGTYKTHHVEISITSGKIFNFTINDTIYQNYDIEALKQIVDKLVEIQAGLAKP